MSRGEREHRWFRVRLALIGAATVVAVGLGSRGTSPQIRVERRLAALAALARSSGCPVLLLAAACVVEGYRERPRSDRELAARLGAAFAEGKAPEAAIAALFPDPVERNTVLDRLRTEEARWRRLLGEAELPR